MSADLETLKRRRDRARARLDRATTAMEAAGAHTRATIPHDPGALSGVAGSGYGKRKSAALRRESEAYKERDTARKLYRMAESRYQAALRDAETSARVVIGDIRPGDLIRTTSWYTVRRVNAKTVTCEPSAPGMDPLRWAHQDIKEHRSVTP